MSLKENKGDIICPISGVLNILNKKWTLSILKDLFKGKIHFNEFKNNKPGLSSVVLSDTLKFLESEKIINKKVMYKNSQKNTEYTLTDKGRKLNIILYQMTLYGLDELECVNLSESEKIEMKEEYKNIFNIKEELL